jgi:uncharacterized protein YndB with AHSA1/START domain
MTTPTSVAVEIRVEAAPDRAFALFTDHIGDWWPIATNSVYDGTVAFEGDELVERSGDRVAVWAEITRWDPPSALGLDWHAGHDRSNATDVLVVFTPDGDGTLVRLTHTGWERLLDGEQKSKEYSRGWPLVLDRFAELPAGRGIRPEPRG